MHATKTEQPTTSIISADRAGRARAESSPSGHDAGSFGQDLKGALGAGLAQGAQDLQPTQLLIDTFGALDAARGASAEDITSQSSARLHERPGFGDAPTTTSDAKTRLGRAPVKSELATETGGARAIEAGERRTIEPARVQEAGPDAGRERAAERPGVSDRTGAPTALRDRAPVETPGSTRTESNNTPPASPAGSAGGGAIEGLKGEPQIAAARIGAIGRAAGAAPGGASQSSGASPAVAGASNQLGKEPAKVFKLVPANAPKGGTERALTSQVMRGLAQVLRQDGGTLKMKLQPRTLGEIEIQLRLQAGSVQGEITAATQSARALLTKNLDELVSSLETRGVTVDRLEVKLAEGAAGERNGQTGDRSGFDGGHGSRDEGGDRNGARRNAPTPDAGREGHEGSAEPDGSHRRESGSPGGQGRPWADDAGFLRLDTLV